MAARCCFNQQRTGIVDERGVLGPPAGSHTAAAAVLIGAILQHLYYADKPSLLRLAVLCVAR